MGKNYSSWNIYRRGFSKSENCMFTTGVHKDVREFM